MKCQPTWTPDALSSNLTELRMQTVWRMVEAQHEIATLTLSDNLADQEVLESILEDSKPPMPPEVKSLHYLLATPFRYKPVDGAFTHDKGSRFRQSGSPDGVFYCAAEADTCAYETAFYRALFFLESPGLAYPSGGINLTAFSTTISSTKVLDLTVHPTLKVFADAWENPANYEACQKLASDARCAGVDIIAYKSVRDPRGGKNYAILDQAVFQSRSIDFQETWSCVLSGRSIYMHCLWPKKTLEVPREKLEKDPRYKKSKAAASAA
jgi:hypothetical protein